MMKKTTFLIVLITISINSFSQICIDKSVPDSSAVLDLSVSNKGLLMPTMNKFEREDMQTNPPSTGLADGLLVFDTDYKRFYFWDISSSTWVVINNWRKSYTYSTADDEDVDIELENNSNLGINEENPKSKLTINGNLCIGDSIVAPADGIYISGNFVAGANSTNSKLAVEDNLSTNSTYTAKVLSGIGTAPIGTIIAYKGDLSDFNSFGIGISGTQMENWAICNNYGGLTPDLRDRFVVGAGGAYNVNDKGGANSVILTVEQMPSHTHTGVTTTDGDHRHKIGYRGIGAAFTGGTTRSVSERYGGSDTPTGSTGNHRHKLYINSTGGSGGHDNRPPFYTLYYIMRIN